MGTVPEQISPLDEMAIDLAIKSIRYNMDGQLHDFFDANHDQMDSIMKDFGRLVLYYRPQLTEDFNFGTEDGLPRGIHQYEVA